jgi:16S rRNA (guanine966-N2)-methyltransferase
VRPTPDRVRETLFNWLRDDIEGARCVDLFAGTGCLGFEALSRGAAEAWLVERDAALARALVAHAEKLGAAAHVVRSDAAAFLERPRGAPFDIVFLDPPYDAATAEPARRARAAARSGALVYVERPEHRTAGVCAIGAINGAHGPRRVVATGSSRPRAEA